MKTTTSSSKKEPAGDEKKALLEAKEQPASPISLDHSSSSKPQFSPKENNAYDDEETEDIDSSMMRLSKTSCGQEGGEEYHLHSPSSVEVSIHNHPSFEKYDEQGTKEEIDDMDEEIGTETKDNLGKKSRNRQGKNVFFAK